MTGQGRKRPKRSSAAARFDEITLAIVTVLLIVIVGAVLTIGVAAAEDRLGCGVNELVNRRLAYPRPCR